MRVWTLFVRELRSLWVTPLAWVLLSSFLLLQGGIFYTVTLHFSQMTDLSPEASPLAAYFGQSSLLLTFTLLLLCPALTMRTLAEERKTGSVELLLAAPIGSLEIVLGKYLATLVTFGLIWSPTLLYSVMLRTALHVDWQVIAVGYLGIGLIGSSYLALGVLTSAMAKSQLIALLLAMLVQFGLFVLGIGEYVFDPGPLRDLSAHLSLTTLLEETAVGLIDTRRLVLHGSVTVWALYVASQLVDSWRHE
ncbi:MAG TPA: ABC transporter permease [Polyangiaceae bacterium]|nr:ABC transporter permease [Polyangiaceae bacterium]